MRVRVLFNCLESLSIEAQRRLSESIHIDGEISGLTLNQEHAVQAIACWKDGMVRYYIHNFSDSDYPNPYPAEFFGVVDSSTPKNWKISSHQMGLFEIGFPEWVDNEMFYENLVDGDPIATALYKKNRR